ncbi:hypothetical protein SNE40_004042 [Patella caerulea]|uniref:Ig-like domain-containing protein n=1 Tax=Patella caerulea TaxID=87958 RepID=A0AAN8KCU5_PATCE
MRKGFIVCVLLLLISEPICSVSELIITPQSVDGIEGDVLTVKCQARNLRYPPKNIFWTRQSLSTDEHKQNFYQHRENNVTSSFHIIKLHRSDAGIYKCVLITYDNTETVNKLTLHVARKSISPSCGHTRFRCMTGDNCIFLRYRCDGTPHCADQSDEKDCPRSVCESKFRCGNSRCIDHIFLCDGSDDCGDYSDELNDNCRLIHMENSKIDDVTLVSPTPIDPDADHFNWLKTTVYIVIGCTVALVIFISFIVIIVFRVKMKRLRARRVARALERHRRHQSGSQHGRPSEHEAFLPVGSNSHYGNIIVNVNNGVQYVPNSEFGGLMEAPPSYAEVVGVELEVRDSPPPAYSTIDRNPKNTVETATNTSRHDLSSTVATPNLMQTQHQSSNSIQTVPENRAQSSNIFTSVEGAVGAIRASHSNINPNSANISSTNIDNSVGHRLSPPPPSCPSTSSHDNTPRVISPRPSASSSSHDNHSVSPPPSNIFMCVEGAVKHLNRPSSSADETTNTPSTSETPVAETPTQASHDSASTRPADETLANQDTDVIPAASGHLAVCGGKIFLRSDSSSSTGTSAVNPPIKGHLEVKGGQIVIKPERNTPGPVSDVPRSSDSDTGSLGRGALQVREGRIVLR